MVIKFKQYALLCTAGAILIARCTDAPQEYRPPELVIETTADSLIAVRDTLRVTVGVEGAAGETIRYCRLRDDSWTIDTSEAATFTAIWEFPDTGLRRIVVWAIDSAEGGRQSNRDTVTVHVVCHTPEVTISGPSNAVIHDTVKLLAEGTDRDGTIEGFEWRVNGGRTFTTPAAEDSLLLQWSKDDTGTQTVLLFAVDNDGLRSAPDSIAVHITSTMPVCALIGDTALSVNDTVAVACRANDADGRVVEYQWSIDGEGSLWFSTRSDTLRRYWRLPDTGWQTIRCRVIDDDGLSSPIDSISIHVFARPPQAAIEGSVRVSVNDSTLFTVHGTDTDGRIVRYQWSIEKSSGTAVETLSDSTITVVWYKADIGKRAVGVIAIDDDSLHSLPAVCSVAVVNDLPELVPFPDTAISSLDTLLISRALADTSRRVAEYFWDLGGDGWDDSTDVPEHVVGYTGVSPLMVIVRVRDTADRFFTDTITVTFNRPPVIDSLSLTDGDTVWMGERAVPGTLPLHIVTSDADSDQVSFSVTWGRGETFDTLDGGDTTRLPIDSTGHYRWSIVATDTWGHRIGKSGGIVVGKEHTVCFAGHSIVTGVYDTLGRGGFRGRVLAGLRDSVGPLTRVRAVGPFISEGWMFANPADDSCFAISGAFAREMLLLMDHAYEELTADIWVLMLGVNGNFSDIETQSTVAMINRMFSRNPHARVYVLLSPPFSRVSPAQRLYYNTHVRATVQQSADSGFGAFIVRSDSVLCLDTAATKTNDSLFYDYPALHPNVEGYQRLSDEILKVMWSVEPRVLPVKEE
ncbi:MAG: SGNH/GDSL hydrolase family protein [Chitinispirillaceae bacterium]|nr:SGNH/GDSL hydrolase family protein [Chitinispirillaceae bacterium]